MFFDTNLIAFTTNDKIKDLLCIFLKESVNDNESTKRKVRFNVVESETGENESEKPKKKVPRVPRESTKEIVDADVEVEKWNDQCKQQ